VTYIEYKTRRDINLHCRKCCPYGPLEVECLDCPLLKHRRLSDIERGKVNIWAREASCA